MLVDSEVLGGPEHFMCVWRSSIERWDPPHDMEPITDADRSQIIEDIRRVVRSRGYGEISVV